MTQFWIISACMILLALGFVAFPLFKKRKAETVDRNTLNIKVIKQQLEELESDLKEGKLEQSVYEAARIDLEKTLLRDVEESSTVVVTTDQSGRWLVFVLAIAMPALSYLLYQQLGTPSAIGADTRNMAAQPRQHSVPAQANAPQMSMDEAIAKLTSRLETEPDNAEGWEMLARTHMSMQNYDKAIYAYEKLHDLIGDNPGFLVSYADALAMAQGGNILGKPFELIKSALAKEPDNAQANWMAGMAEAEQGNQQAALNHWNKVRPLVATQPELLVTLDKMIAEAKTRLSGTEIAAVDSTQPKTPTTEPAPTVAPVAEPAASSGGQEMITVEVELAPELAAQADPEDTVFIFAQAMQGPPMPLAVSRQQVKNLPITVSLDDGMAMMPQMKLSSFEQVKVGARISKSGQAMPSSGDLSGSVDAIKPGQSEPVKVLINQKIP